MNLKERINQNINDAYVDYGDFRTSLAEDYLLETCKEFAISFSLFCARNTFTFDGEEYRMKELKPTFKTPEELLTLYLENERNTPL